jgi:TRAP-type C4-dicarboxylate transport system substrate-binding protein
VTGSIDMMLTGSSIWATVGPELGMLDLGYVFDSDANVLGAAGFAELLSVLMRPSCISRRA